MEVCNHMEECNWTSNNTCVAYTCADKKTKDSCLPVILDNMSGINICSWNKTTEKCEDAADSSALTSSDCHDKTLGYYYWDGSACTECKGLNSIRQIFLFMEFIIMVMF